MDAIKALLKLIPFKMQVEFALYCAIDVQVRLDKKDIISLETNRIVAKWLKDENSVSKQELKDAANAASAADAAADAAANAANAAADAANAAAYAAYAAADAANAAYAAANAAASAAYKKKLKQYEKHLKQMIKSLSELERVVLNISKDL